MDTNNLFAIIILEQMTSKTYRKHVSRHRNRRQRGGFVSRGPLGIGAIMGPTPHLVERPVLQARIMRGSGRRRTHRRKRMVGRGTTQLPNNMGFGDLMNILPFFL
jgi:hypothetical protein